MLLHFSSSGRRRNPIIGRRRRGRRTERLLGAAFGTALGPAVAAAVRRGGRLPVAALLVVDGGGDRLDGFLRVHQGARRPALVCRLLSGGEKEKEKQHDNKGYANRDEEGAA